MASPDSKEDLPSPPISSPDPEPEVNLAHLEPVQRAQFLKQHFSKRVEPLAYIDEPDECNLWPEFRDEIVEAYLHNTTFSVQVWANYDAAAKQFYIDKRIEDTGKIVIDPARRKRLDKINAKNALEFGRVQLEIGTAFTNICTIKIYAMNTKGGADMEVRARTLARDAEHPRLVDFVENVRRDLDSCTLTADQKGFLLSDLDNVAAGFRRQPTQVEATRMAWNNAPAWMDFENDDAKNPGWLDFEALDKECSIACKGCSGSGYYSRYSGGGLTSSRYWWT